MTYNDVYRRIFWQVQSIRPDNIKQRVARRTSSGPFDTGFAGFDAVSLSIFFTAVNPAVYLPQSERLPDRVTEVFACKHRSPKAGLVAREMWRRPHPPPPPPPVLAILARPAKITPMSTVTVNISLTDDLKAFVDTRIKARGYKSTSEYMRDLVRRDEERVKEEQAKVERFRALIQEGLDSPIDPRPWEEIRAGWLEKIDTARTTQSQKTT